MGGCMLLIIAQQKENATRIMEDGYSIMLNNDQWKTFWKAISEKNSFNLNTTEKFMDFSLIWT